MSKNENINKIQIEGGIFPYTQKEAEEAGIKSGTSNINREMHFPKVIKKERDRLGLTQQQVADKIGVTKSTIGLYENGDNIPDIKNLYKLAKLFGVSADYLIGMSGDFRNPDIDIRSIHDKTGLSAGAIINIISFNKNFSDAGQSGMSHALNKLLEQMDFFWLLLDISSHFLEAENMKSYENTNSEEDLLTIAFNNSDEIMNCSSVTLNPIQYYYFSENQIKEKFINIVRSMMDAHIASIDASEMVRKRIEGYREHQKKLSGIFEKE